LLRKHQRQGFRDIEGRLRTDQGSGCPGWIVPEWPDGQHQESSVGKAGRVAVAPWRGQFLRPKRIARQDLLPIVRGRLGEVRGRCGKCHGRNATVVVEPMKGAYSTVLVWRWGIRFSPR